MSQPRIILFGDSHTYAVQRALERRVIKSRALPLAAHRLLKEKNGKHVGDTSFEDFLNLARQLGPDDIALSMIGGNQHAVFSTIQHPEPFDFADYDGLSEVRSDAQLIPYRVIHDVFARGIRKGDGKSIESLRKSTRARVVHIIPPPPKRDNEFIEKHHESLFAKEGITTHGVSQPDLRLKFWRLQTRILEQFCRELGVEVLMPPAAALDEQGFLAKDFYANDATHANPEYGELLLTEVERQLLPKQAGAQG